MGEVINLEKSKEMMEANSSFKDIMNLLSFDGDNDGATALFSVLYLDDPEFTIVSELLLSNLEKTLNDQTAKLALVQSLNSSGLKAEDLVASVQDIAEQIQNTAEFKQFDVAKRDYLTKIVTIFVNAVMETEGVAKKIITVPVELCHEDAKIPTYVHAGDAGMDIYAVEDITIKPGETVIVPTGLKTAIPLGYELQVRPRSGLSAKSPLRIANSIGTIDANYRGEIGVIITNSNPPITKIEFDEKGNVIDYIYGEDYTITKGMRFAQLVLKEVPTCSFLQVESVADIGEDRNSGFGGSGLF
nr:MAG TPA: deoxyuridine 5'-triphosphate nucleotidohydrolase [Caudoviricetes sp.]